MLARPDAPRTISSERRHGSLVGWAGPALLLFLALVFSGLLAEGVVRLLVPEWKPRTAAISLFWHHDPHLGWAHVPGARGWFDAFGRRTEVVINSKGFRDAERAYERDPTKSRLVVLGDSMVWGYGVEQDEMFTILMERAGPGLEVINLGVSGYGTDQELLLLQDRALCYRPDAVAVVVVENDLQTNVQRKAYLVYHKPMFVLTPDGSLVVTNVPVPRRRVWESAASGLMRHSFLLNRLASWYVQPRARPAVAGSSPAGPAGRLPFPRDAEERVTAAMLLEMDRVVRRTGAQFLIVLVDGLGLRGREMEDFVRARGIRTVNLDTAIRPDSGTGFHLNDGSHWSGAGHRRVADRLLAEIEAWGITSAGARLERAQANTGRCG